MRGGGDPFLSTPIPLITLASCTPQIRPVLIPVPKGGGYKVYRSAKDWAPRPSQNQDALGSSDTSFLTIMRPHSSTTPVAVNQGQISKGAALFLPRIPFYGFLWPVFSTLFLFILTRDRRITLTLLSECFLPSYQMAPALEVKALCLVSCF